MRYVYFIAGGGRTKVGLSMNPESRLRDLQTGSPVSLRLLRAVEGNWYLEGRIHEALADRRLEGEWFEGEFTDAEIDDVMSDVTDAIADVESEKEVRAAMIANGVEPTYLDRNGRRYRPGERGGTRRPEYDTPEFRAHLLARSRAGEGVRAIAADPNIGLGKSSVARCLKQALAEESEAQDADKRAAAAEQARTAPPEESRPAAKVWLSGQQGLTTARGQPVSSPLMLKPIYPDSPAVEVVKRERENDWLIMQANVRAGLSPDGMATYETEIGRLSFDPLDRGDCERVRVLLRDEAEHLAREQGDVFAGWARAGQEAVDAFDQTVQEIRRRPGIR